MASTQPVTAGNSTSHPYTCNTCQVAYRNIDLQKTHMKSDWHRYNLKRRVASLPPISADLFTEKVLQARAASTAEADKAYFERVCEACSKTYYSDNAYHNHLLSQKHKSNGSSASQDSHEEETRSMISSTFSLGDPVQLPKEEVDSDAEDEFNQVVEGLRKAKLDKHQRPSPVKRPSNPGPVGDAAGSSIQQDSNSTTPVPSSAEPQWTPGSCIFCNYESPTMALNAHHMERFHGMFIPERPYLVDLEGLLQHLQQRVRVSHECLYCSKVKSTIFGVQTHMRDKGHCKIPYSTEPEQLDIGEFYDFRSTYSDDEESESGSDEEGIGGAKLGARRTAKTTASNGEELDKEDEGWETDSSESSLDSADLTAVPAEGHIHQFERLDKHPHHSHHDPRNRHQVDGWHSRAHKHTHAAFYDDYELHLPSGKSVGHRSLNRYYRQNLTNYPTAEERAERLAIEAAEDDEMDVEDQDDNDSEMRDGRGRQIIPRGAAGLAGVSVEKKQAVRRSENRGRKLEDHRTKKKDLAYSTKSNNYAGYHYTYGRGG